MKTLWDKALILPAKSKLVNSTLSILLVVNGKKSQARQASVLRKAKRSTNLFLLSAMSFLRLPTVKLDSIFLSVIPNWLDSLKTRLVATAKQLWWQWSHLLRTLSMSRTRRWSLQIVLSISKMRLTSMRTWTNGLSCASTRPSWRS